MLRIQASWLRSLVVGLATLAVLVPPLGAARSADLRLEASATRDHRGPAESGVSANAREPRGAGRTYVVIRGVTPGERPPPGAAKIRRALRETDRWYHRVSAGSVPRARVQIKTVRLTGRWASCRAQSRNALAYVQLMDAKAHVGLPRNEFSANLQLSHCPVWTIENAFASSTSIRGFSTGSVVTVLGLDVFSLGMAATFGCRQSGRDRSFAGSCEVDMMGDPFSYLGTAPLRPPRLTAPQLAVNRWLPADRIRTMPGSKDEMTVRLSPVSSASGTQALRVRVTRPRQGQGDYSDYLWIEFSRGVQLRLDSVTDLSTFAVGRGLVDATPGSRSGYGDFRDAALPPGSSVTTTHGVVVTVVRESTDHAVIRVERGAPQPKAPAAPAEVVATPEGTTAHLSWQRPADRGAAITSYVLIASDGSTRTLRSLGGTTTTFDYTGLTPAQTYTFQVRAVNEAGPSAASASSDPITTGAG